MGDSTLLFAAASGGEVFLAFVMIGVAILIPLVVAAVQGPARYNVVIRGGAPYCPQCNRQVSYRRDYCRCCGYKFVTYGDTYHPELSNQSLAERREAARQEREAREKRAAEARARRAERLAARAERDKAYRAMGIEPGPLAWFKALPDVVQAIGLGVVIALSL